MGRVHVTVTKNGKSCSAPRRPRTRCECGRWRPDDGRLMCDRCYVKNSDQWKPYITYVPSDPYEAPDPMEVD